MYLLMIEQQIIHVWTWLSVAICMMYIIIKSVNKKCKVWFSSYLVKSFWHASSSWRNRMQGAWKRCGFPRECKHCWTISRTLQTLRAWALLRDRVCRMLWNKEEKSDFTVSELKQLHSWEKNVVHSKAVKWWSHTLLLWEPDPLWSWGYVWLLGSDPWRMRSCEALLSIDTTGGVGETGWMGLYGGRQRERLVLLPGWTGSLWSFCGLTCYVHKRSDLELQWAGLLPQCSQSVTPEMSWPESPLQRWNLSGEVEH